MKKLILIIFILLLIGIALVGCEKEPPTPSPPTPTLIADQYTYEDLIQVFDYDPQAPLEIQELSVSDEEEGIKVHDILYTGGVGDIVSAYLVVPPSEGPFPGIIFMHHGRGTKYSHLNEAIQLAKHGVVSLLVQGGFNPQAYTFKRVVLSLRRGADLLTSRQDVDSSRLGYVGHSWGATFGGILTDVDGRFKTHILIAGVPYLSEYWEGNALEPFDGVYYIGQAAPASLFFQFANQDEAVSRETALLYYDAASEPKDIKWYDSDHEFTNSEEAQQDRLKWLSTELDLP